MSVINRLANWFSCISSSIIFILTIHNLTDAFAYDLFWVVKLWPRICKTLHFGLQYAAYWLAKPWVLQRKMHAFGL